MEHWNIHPLNVYISLSLSLAGIDLDAEAVYMAGHSLGLMPVSAPSLMQEEMDKWAKKCVIQNYNTAYIMLPSLYVLSIYLCVCACVCVCL